MNTLEEKIEGTIHLLLYILQKLGRRAYLAGSLPCNEKWARSFYRL